MPEEYDMLPKNTSAVSTPPAPSYLRGELLTRKKVETQNILRLYKFVCNQLIARGNQLKAKLITSSP